MAMNIFEPQKSKVVKGLQGKIYVIYEDNRTGKTAQAARFDKPYFLLMEPGLEAISGVDFQYIDKWSDAIAFARQISRPENLEQFKERWSTIVIDPLDAFSRVATRYVLEYMDKQFMGEKKKGDSKFTQEYAFLETIVQEFVKTITTLGITIVFLDHPTYETVTVDGTEYKYATPAGDKRVVKMVCDLATIGYAKANGVDEKGRVIPSTLYLTENPKGWKAGSRYDYMVSFVEFSKENLEKAMIDAIEADERVKKGDIVDINTYNKNNASTKEDLDTIKKKIGALRKNIKAVDETLTPYIKALGDRFGDPDIKIKSLGEDKRVGMELVISDLEEYLKNVNETVVTASED